MAKTPIAIDQLTYEQAVQELEEILNSLEGEPRGLDETMGLFERGKALIQRCQDLLDQAELKVRTLENNLTETPSEEKE
jgi:exodeoxyribonuclease VII small subunit